MDKDLFNELVVSLEEANKIKKGLVKPLRLFEIEGINIKNIRARLELSQVEFANMLHIRPKTLQNWEQNRRKPTGAARTLLKIIDVLPPNMLAILKTQFFEHGSIPKQTPHSQN